MAIDVERTRQAREQAEYKGSSFWKPKAGDGTFADNYVRVLPPHEKLDGKLFLPVSLHWLPDKRSFLCPREMFNGRCVFHEEGFRLLNSRKPVVGEKQAKEEARPYWASWAFYLNIAILNKDGTPAEDQPRVWSANKDVADLLFDLLNEDGEVVDYTDLESGFMLNVRAKKVKDGNWEKHDYIIRKANKPTAFDYPELVAAAVDPTTLNQIMPADEMEKLLAGGLAPEGVAEDPLNLPEGTVQEVKDEAPAVPKDELWGDDPPGNGAAPDPTPEEKPKRTAKKKEDAADAEARRAELRAQLK